jgi:hypothetical protein
MLAPLPAAVMCMSVQAKTTAARESRCAGRSNRNRKARRGGGCRLRRTEHRNKSFNLEMSEPGLRAQHLRMA